MKTILRISFIILSILAINSIQAQNNNRIQLISIELDSLSKKVSGLNKELDFSVSGSTIQEFVRAVGISNKINISIDPTLNIKLMNNFSQVKARDILIFLCEEYRLDIKIIGSIISIHKYNPPTQITSVVKKKLNIRYQEKGKLLSMDLKEDSIEAVVKVLTNVSKRNVILAPNARGRLTNSYIQNMPFESTLEKFAFANNLSLTISKDSFYILSALIQSQKNKNSNKNNQNTHVNDNNLPQQGSNFTLTTENDKIFLEAYDIELNQIVSAVCKEMNVNYYLLSPINEKATIYLHNVDFADFLFYLLSGTGYTYLEEDECYIIGKSDEKGMKETVGIQLQHRSVVEINKMIPSSMQNGVEIIEFTDQNSLIINGSRTDIEEIKRFISEIDKVVPMIVIELLIIDNTSSYTISTGIQAGIGESSIQNSVTVSPGLNVSLNAASINKILNSFNGLGLINLGAVTPNFYLSLKAMEANGFITVKSTPKLATLNGSEASLTLGNTKYYYEDSDKIISNNSTTNISTRQYKSLQANFTISIKPIVSGDEQITLDITVDQSDFTGEVIEGAPPGQVTRSFSSVVRVKNQEMILLGGLEEVSRTEEGSGLPFISRIPILKWIFGNKKKSKKKSKLNIFIKPTVIY